VIVLPSCRRGTGVQALNPREIWIVVVLVSALSFVGFVPCACSRGTRMRSRAVGGLVSSTRSHLDASARTPGRGRGATAACSSTSLRAHGLLAARSIRHLPRLLPILR